MGVYVEPAWAQWQPGAASADRSADRAALARIIHAHAQRLGTGRWMSGAGESGLKGPGLTGLHEAQLPGVVATGHQAWLWHPGILAKDMAMAQACARWGMAGVHLVVDQDAHEALTLELPVREGSRLRAERLTLAVTSDVVPTGAQQPVAAAAVLTALVTAGERLGKNLACDLGPLREAWRGLPECRTLAEQVTVVLQRLMGPYTGALPVVFATDLAQLPGFAKVLRRMVAEAEVCARAYNQAVALHPEAGISPLRMTEAGVELPVWWMSPGRERQRIFVQPGKNETGRLRTEAGEILEPGQGGQLAPRALLLTALWRGLWCDLFIHGKGGGVYDRVTEAWWRTWTGESLGLMTVVSADVYLELGAPVAERGEVTRAVWWRHHLKHNLDRELRLAEPARRKAELLKVLASGHTRADKARAFAELHRINDQLCAGHADALAQAAHQLEIAQQGWANRGIARKRDWCFALYLPAQLLALRGELAAGVAQVGRTKMPGASPP